MSKNVMLEAALKYVEKGFAVLPVNPDKSPALTNGSKGATTDPDVVRNWWTGEYTNLNIGLATGSVSGLFVADIDNKPGSANGFATLETLIAQNDNMPATVSQVTGYGKH